MEEARRTHCLVVGIAALATLVAPGVYADTVAKVTVTQATVQLPAITAYLDVKDADGQPVQGPGDFNVGATLDGRRLPLTALTTLDESGEGAAYFFLIDVSRSLGLQQFAAMRLAMSVWIDGLHGRDRIAMASFGEGYRILLDFTADKQAARAVVGSLAASDRRTELYLALQHALGVASRSDQDLPSRRVVVLLSDGKDEGSGVTIDDLRSQMLAARVPIFAIGYSNFPADERRRHLDALHRLANLSGGAYREASAASLRQDYAEMSRAVRGVHVARFSCDGCRPSEGSHPLKIALTNGSATLVDVVALAVQPPSAWRQVPNWSYALLVGLLAIGIVLVASTTRRSAGRAIGPIGPGDVVPPTGPEPISATRPVGLPITLATVKGHDAGRVHQLNLVERARIGRGHECDVVVRDDEISAVHCDLVVANGQVMLRDLGSRNGTLVNGAQVVRQARVESGDSIRVGRTELRIAISGQL